MRVGSPAQISISPDQPKRVSQRELPESAAVLPSVRGGTRLVAVEEPTTVRRGFPEISCRLISVARWLSIEVANPETPVGQRRGRLSERCPAARVRIMGHSREHRSRTSTDASLVAATGQQEEWWNGLKTALGRVRNRDGGIAFCVLCMSGRNEIGQNGGSLMAAGT